MINQILSKYDIFQYLKKIGDIKLLKYLKDEINGRSTLDQA